VAREVVQDVWYSNTVGVLQFLRDHVAIVFGHVAMVFGHVAIVFGQNAARHQWRKELEC
jgi:hypothetical protein